jgi:hypothetical protein
MLCFYYGGTVDFLVWRQNDCETQDVNGRELMIQMQKNNSMNSRVIKYLNIYILNNVAPDIYINL